MASVDWFVSLHTKLKLTQPSALTDKYPELYALYQAGKLALFQHGLRSWKIQADVLGDQASAFPFPRGAKARWVNTGMNGTSIFKGTRYVEQAWAWAATTAEPAMARRMSLERGSPATLKSLANDPIYTENRFYRAAMTDPGAWGQLPTYHKNWAKMIEQWTPEFQRLLQGETTVAALCQASANVLRQA
jgi:multiple sugar transport system substrate-binding protein